MRARGRDRGRIGYVELSAKQRHGIVAGSASGMHEILTEHATGARDEEAHGAPMDSASALRRAARGWRWGLELPDLEDLGPTVRARTLDRGAAVLHGHLLRVLDLHLLAFLDAVTLWHHRPPLGVRCVAVNARLRLRTDNARLITCQSAQVLRTATGESSPRPR